MSTKAIRHGNWGAIEKEAGPATAQIIRRIANALSIGGGSGTGSGGGGGSLVSIAEAGPHAWKHANGGSTKQTVGKDPIGPYSFNWSHEHTFQMGTPDRVALTLKRISNQTSDFIFVQDESANELFELNSESQLSIGAPAEKGSALNVKALTLPNGTGAGQDPSDLTALAGGLFVWYRAEDITGMNDEDEFVNNDPVWANHATTVPGNPAYENAADTVSTGCDGPNYYAGTNALGLNGYPTVVRSPNADAVTGYRDIGFSIGINDPYTIIAVYRAAPNSSLVLGNSTTFAEAFTFPSNAPNAKALVYHTGSPTDITSEFDNTVGLYGTDDWHIAVWTSNGVYIAYRHDGADLGSATAAVSSMAGEFFNGRLNGQYSSNKGAGVVELIQYDTELSTENIEALEAYLVDKYFSGSSDVIQWDAGDGVDGIIKKTTGNMGVGTLSPAAKLDVLATTEQARLSYDASNYASLTVDANGNLAVALTGTTPEATFADNVNVSGEVLITGANGLYFGAKATGAQIAVSGADLVINPDVDSNSGILNITDGVEILQSNASILGLQLTAASGATDVFEILKDGGSSTFKVTDAGRLYGPDGIVPMAFYSRTDNDGITPKGLFEFYRDTGADGSSFHTKWYGAAGATILDLTMAGQLRYEGDSNKEYLWESGSFTEVTFTSKPTFDSGWLTKKIAEPTTPASTYGSVFLDTADGILKIKHDDGTVVNLENGAVATPFDVYVDVKERQTLNELHGGFNSLSLADTLDSGTDIDVTCGIGKVVFVVNAGTDLTGDITITGTSVDRETGNETASDTDVISIDGLTTDNGTTDANGVDEIDLANAYISSKWFIGDITISTSDVDLSDVDVYQVAFEQANDQTEFQLDTLDFSALANNNSAWASLHLYALKVTGSTCTIAAAANADLTAAEVDADKWYRLRRGNINEDMDGSTDGFWVDMVLGPINQNYWENINAKVWILSPLSGVVAVGGAGSFDPAISYTWTADQTVNDNVEWQFGTGADGEIHYDGTSSLVFDVATGSGHSFRINNSEKFRIGAAFATSEVQLRLGDNIHLALGDAQDARIYYDGTNLVIDPMAAGSGVCQITGNAYIQPDAGSAILRIRVADTTSTANIYFGDSGDFNPGRIVYNNSVDTMYFYAANTASFQIEAASVTTLMPFRVDDNPIRFKEMAAPPTPASTYGQLFLDSVTGNLSILKDTGTKVDLEAGGGGASSPLTTKGDIWGYDTGDERIPVGTDDYVLTADSSAALGVSWQAAGGGGGGNDLAPTAVKTANYTAVAWDAVLVDTSAGTFTVTLPASSTGDQVLVKMVGTGTNIVTIDGNASETIDGALTKTLLAQYESLLLLADGSNWHIIG